ncbi:MAG: type 2 isopentenyl-diphosphate Delta-isomerase [Spirochaetes bacterium]|jgi:isopentenyl-diphosphate delta-isomerase type 2|nr:type 2 isopentenyl-diphosphate Delta-isomerase [Spirochaetota bacterium]
MNENIGERKARHLSICVDESRYSVESGSAGFDELSFVHRALPEIGAGDIDTGLDFLGMRIRMPLLISSMTGGSDQGYEANKNLARAAQEAGIPVGMGSMRILFRKPEVFDHFYLKRYAPDVPVFANMGGVQIRDFPRQEVIEMIRRLEVDALVVHLNAGQELFQDGGDRDFAGILDGISRFCDASPVPVIVKETGFGIHPGEVTRLLNAGVSYVNLAGSGGTNWVTVEAYRLDGTMQAAADEFASWGTPTAPLLAAVGRREGRIIASGGLRSGMDVAKATAMGAELSGLALPFIRAVVSQGVEGVVEVTQKLRKTLETVMIMTSSRTLEDLRRVTLLRSPGFDKQVRALEQAAGDASKDTVG